MEARKLTLLIAASMPLLAACGETAEEPPFDLESPASAPQTTLPSKAEEPAPRDTPHAAPVGAEVADSKPTSLADKWQKNGFVLLPEGYVWLGDGSGADDTYAVLGVPETDDQVLAAGCEGGRVDLTLLLYDQEPADGVSAPFHAQVEGRQVHTLSIIGRPYGEGFANSLQLDTGHPLLAEMTEGTWVYWQVGGHESRGKVRVSLAGAEPHLSRLIKNC